MLSKITNLLGWVGVALVFGAFALRFLRPEEMSLWWNLAAAGLVCVLIYVAGQWREFAVQNDHQFDALICAYTAYLWTRDGWQLPPDPRRVFAEDGWIWFPPKAQPPKKPG